MIGNKSPWRPRPPPHDALLHAWLEQRPHRLSTANGGVEQTLGSPPEGLKEPVDAVAGRGDALDPGTPTEGSLNILDGGEPRLLLGEPPSATWDPLGDARLGAPMLYA